MPDLDSAQKNEVVSGPKGIAPLKVTWSVTSAALFFGSGVCLFFLLISGLVLLEQQDIVRISSITRAETVPFLLDRQRIVRNLEQLHHYGELVVNAADKETRDNALFLATILASHQSLRVDPGIYSVVDQAKQAMDKANALLAQDVGPIRDDLRKGDLALLTKREEAKQLWQAGSGPLIDLADNLAVAGAEVAIQQAAHASESASRAGYWLLVALISLLALIVAALLVVRRYLVAPFIRIAGAVDFVKAKHQVPYLPQSRLREIAQSYAATTQLAHVILSEEAARRRFETLSQTDELSSLPNRRYFFECAQVEWNIIRMSHLQMRPLSVLMIDLDHFKRINDRYGHAVGDRVIQIFCSRVSALLRQEDFPGRLGGEEFAVLLPNTTMEKALQVGERFRAAMADTPFIVEDQQPIEVSISVGVATVQPEDNCIDDTMKRADAALYYAKNQGRNRVVGEVFLPQQGSLAL